jgi:hypothetical protein
MRETLAVVGVARCRVTVKSLAAVPRRKRLAVSSSISSG